MTSELPDVWVVNETSGELPHSFNREEDAERAKRDYDEFLHNDGPHSCERYVPASRIASLEARNARLVEALRKMGGAATWGDAQAIADAALAQEAGRDK